MMSVNLSERPGTPGIDIVELVDGIAEWCQCLHGQRTIRTGLRAVARAFDAAVATLVKVDTHGNGSMRSIVVSPDAQARSLDRGLADLILGAYLPRAKVASVWFGSMAAEDAEGALAMVRRQCGLAETVVIVLAQEGKWTHLLELSFVHRLTSAQAAMTNSLATTLAQTWAERTPGLLSEALLANRPAHPNAALSAPILSDTNPMGLSRAEFRVCLLLSNGLSREAVRDELKITASTLRSHIRQICAKVDCRNTNELIHRLLVATCRPGLATNDGATAARRVS